MLTKAIIQSINAAGTRCLVRIPLFETASDPNPVEAEALVSISPGLFNNLEIGDVVFIAFEENAMEKPVILGKLFRGATTENSMRGGGGMLDSLKVCSSASLPASTLYSFPGELQNHYRNLNTPKKVADYIKWLEKLTKQCVVQLEDHFSCFKSWVQWQLRPGHLEVDDGDLDLSPDMSETELYKSEGSNCNICGKACTKNNKRLYLKLSADKNYPDT